MCLALWAVFPVGVCEEVFEDTAFAEGVQALVDRVSVSEEAVAERASKERVQVGFSDLIDKLCLLRFGVVPFMLNLPGLGLRHKRL